MTIRVIGLIWAQTPARVIGAKNGIPWHLPEDMAHFRAVTRGHPVIMGRRTWDSLPDRFRPLPGRRNLVVTRQPEFTAPGAEPFPSVPEALGHTTGEVWVIGGGQIYQEALDFATDLQITEVDLPVAGDTYAPILGAEWVTTDPDTWQVSRTDIRYRIRHFHRANSPTAPSPTTSHIE